MPPVAIRSRIWYLPKVWIAGFATFTGGSRRGGATLARSVTAAYTRRETNAGRAASRRPPPRSRGRRGHGPARHPDPERADVPDDGPRYRDVRGRRGAARRVGRVRRRVRGPLPAVRGRGPPGRG